MDCRIFVISLIGIFSIIIIPVYADNNSTNSTNYIELKWWELASTEIKLPHIETLKKIESEKLKIELENKRLEELANKTPRSEYTLSETEEIVILGHMPNNHPSNKNMDFDIRVVDTYRNPFVKWQTYWDDNMGVNDVVITAKVIDPNGRILNEMSGVTENKGKYSSEDTYFSNFYQSSSYSIIVNAIRYFDIEETYAITSLTHEFNIFYSPRDNRSPDGGIIYYVDLEDSLSISDSTEYVK